MKVKKEEIKQWVNDVYTKLRVLFSLCEETDGFNTVPEGEAEEDAQKFLSRKMGEIRGAVENFSLYMDEQEIAELKKLKPGLMALFDLGLVATIDPEVREVNEKLQRIVNETGQFLGRRIERREAAGVVFRWHALNPRLTYFDNVFDLMERYPETYKEMVAEYPGPELVAERNAYFEKIKEQNEREKRNWSTNRIFQEELLNTLQLLFERDLKEYL